MLTVGELGILAREVRRGSLGCVVSCVYADILRARLGHALVRARRVPGGGPWLARRNRSSYGAQPGMDAPILDIIGRGTP